MRRTAAIALVAAMSGCTATGPTPAPAPAPTAATTAPSPASTLPACKTEDGAGMALCWWAKGRVVSGDCAPGVMGDDSALCVRVYRLPKRTRTYQGAQTTDPAGPDLVEECADIRRHGTPADLKADGWTMAGCLTGALTE